VGKIKASDLWFVAAAVGAFGFSVGLFSGDYSRGNIGIAALFLIFGINGRRKIKAQKI
jgi:hypothetical protein